MAEVGEGAELANELVMESAGEGSAEEKPEWHGKLAAFTLVLALLTAIGALLAGITAHESLIEETEESIETTIIEGDRVTIEVLRAKHDILASLGVTPDQAEVDRVAAYEEDAAKKAETVQDEETDVGRANSAHLIFAVAVTLMSVGIAVSGMAIIVDTRRLWGAGIVFGAAGSVGLVAGLLVMFD